MAMLTSGRRHVKAMSCTPATQCRAHRPQEINQRGRPCEHLLSRMFFLAIPGRARFPAQGTARLSRPRPGTRPIREIEPSHLVSSTGAHNLPERNIRVSGNHPLCARCLKSRLNSPCPRTIVLLVQATCLSSTRTVEQQCMDCRSMMQNQRPVLPDIDTHRVQSLRNLIAEEVYIINSRQIADKIIDLENALFHPQQRPA